MLEEIYRCFLVLGREEQALGRSSGAGGFQGNNVADVALRQTEQRRVVAAQVVGRGERQALQRLRRRQRSLVDISEQAPVEGTALLCPSDGFDKPGHLVVAEGNSAQACREPGIEGVGTEHCFQVAVQAARRYSDSPDTEVRL